MLKISNGLTDILLIAWPPIKSSNANFREALRFPPSIDTTDTSFELISFMTETSKRLYPLNSSTSEGIRVSKDFNLK